MDFNVYFSIKKDHKKNEEENFAKSDFGKRSKTCDVKKVRIVESEFVMKIDKKRFSDLEEDLSKNISSFKPDKDLIISKNEEVLKSALKKIDKNEKNEKIGIIDENEEIFVNLEKEKNDNNKILGNSKNENLDELEKKIDYNKVDFSELSTMDFTTLTKSRSQFDLRKNSVNELEVIDEDEEINFL